MSSHQDPNSQPQVTPKRGGLFAQFLELFGMTPTVQSGPTGVKKDSIVAQSPSPPKPKCRACYNPATWYEDEERWRCPDHPNAEILESS
jgi:hypothetical protein